jgi:hypothetical protein
MNNLNDGKIFFSGFVLGAFTFILLLYMTKPEPPVSPQPVASKSNFEVVDTYMGCDVVSWTQPNFAQYKYFLHCPK